LAGDYPHARIGIDMGRCSRRGGTGEVFKYTSPAPEKPGKYLNTPFRRRRSIYTHLSGAGEAGEAGEDGEVFIYTGNVYTRYIQGMRLK